MQWHMQAGNITTNIKVEVNFSLPAPSTKNFMWMTLPREDTK